MVIFSSARVVDLLSSEEHFYREVAANIQAAMHEVRGKAVNPHGFPSRVEVYVDVRMYVEDEARV